CVCRNRESPHHQWLFLAEDLRSECQSATIAAAEKTSTYLCARRCASAVRSRNLRLEYCSSGFGEDGELCAPRSHHAGKIWITFQPGEAGQADFNRFQGVRIESQGLQYCRCYLRGCRRGLHDAGVQLRARNNQADIGVSEAETTVP